MTLPLAADLPTATAVFTALGYGVVSALVPVVNSELYIIGAATVLPVRVQPVVLLVFTAGTMLGKGALYLVSERVIQGRSAAVQAQVAKWVDNLHRRRHIVWPIVFASASVGFPPYYPVSLAAGVMRLGLGGFFLVGFIGRFMRFSFITWAAQGWLASWR